MEIKSQSDQTLANDWILYSQIILFLMKGEATKNLYVVPISTGRWTFGYLLEFPVDFSLM